MHLKIGNRCASAIGLTLIVLLFTGCNAMSETDKENSGYFRASDRVVFLGDSITDGDTLPLLIAQALQEAGIAPPTMINAGVGGDTISMMHARLDRDVFARNPSVVLINAGANDAGRKITSADYAEDLKAITDQLDAQSVRVILVTPTSVGPKHARNRPYLAAYEQAMSDLAGAKDYPIAQISRVFCQSAGFDQPRLELLGGDDLHLDFAGYRVMARTVLDALAYPQLPVPQQQNLQILPGLIRDWRIRPIGQKKLPLNALAVSNLKPQSDAWKAYSLPEPEPVDGWWPDQERQRGFAMNVSKYVGKSKQYLGHAIVESQTDRQVQFNTGGGLSSIWLNGEELYRQVGWTGFHAGKERIAATLKPGINTVVIEFSGSFFLSVMPRAFPSQP